MKPNLLNTTSQVHVPGPASLPWEVSDVPHGEVHHHFYKSAVVGDQRDFYVYTPPGMNPRGSRSYPVLYLLHGFSDDASGWTAVGRAHVIMDNLIAQGKTKPMVVVMPLGYGAPGNSARAGSARFANTSCATATFANSARRCWARCSRASRSAYLVNKDRNSRGDCGPFHGAEASRCSRV